MKNTYTIIVLNDGETWSTAAGCSLCVISDDDMAKLESGEITPRDLQPISEIGFSNHTAN